MSGSNFRNMDPEKHRQIASMGGRAAHASGNAHQFDSEEAREAGRKGGYAVAKNPAHMSRIGTLGGRASARARANRNAATTSQEPSR